ncbi:MAG: hypothetical protein ACLQOO_33380 [Terriglobia bacterium]
MRTLLRRVSRLERNTPRIHDEFSAGFLGRLSDEDLDRQIVELEQVVFGDDRAALEAFQREALLGAGVECCTL